MSDDPNSDRFSDGFQVIIDNEVAYDSEAEFYGTESKVGQKVPNAKPKLVISPERRMQITKTLRIAKMRNSKRE
jgi:hypothetical protein